MTVKELMELLKTYPENTKVYVAEVQNDDWGYGKWVEFDPKEHLECIDLRDNPFAKGKPYANDVDLYLGYI